MEKPNKKDYLSIKKYSTHQYYLDLEKYVNHIEPPEDPIFTISTLTLYTHEEISDFILLTGIKIDKAQRVLLILNNCGITNLINVNRLAKIDLLKLESI